MASSDEYWVVRRNRPVTWDDQYLCEYLVLDGPFAYPRWSGVRATVLSKNEAHQHAMSFGSPHSEASHLAIPTTWAPNVALQPKWRPMSSDEIRERERGPFTGG